MSASDQTELHALASVEQPSLDSLAATANAEHQSAMRSGWEFAERARAVGDALLPAKARLPHGEWGPWQRQNLKFSERTARDYMTVARRWPEIQKQKQNGSAAAILSLRDALYLLQTANDKEDSLSRVPPSAQKLHETVIRREFMMVRHLRVFFDGLARSRLWLRGDVDAPVLSEVTLAQIVEMRPSVVEWLNLLADAAQVELARRPKLTYRSQESASREAA